MVKSVLILLLLPALSWAAPQAGDIREASGFTWVFVPAGCFDMGSNAGSADEQPVHQVCLDEGLWLGQTEVSQAQYLTVVGGNPSMFSDDDSHPVESISWREATEMAAKLSAQTGDRYRLPSESEWAYACTAGGKHSLYCGDAALEAQAWYLENSDDSTQPVGELEANAWGLLDMTGNVREWVQDCWNDSYQDAPNDGSAWVSGDCEHRVVRGGSWTIGEEWLRLTNRNRNHRTSPSNFIGFRLVLEP